MEALHKAARNLANMPWLMRLLLFDEDVAHQIHCSLRTIASYHRGRRRMALLTILHVLEIDNAPSVVSKVSRVAWTRSDKVTAFQKGFVIGSRLINLSCHIHVHRAEVC